MKRYLMKRFALTEKGAADMLKAILATTLSNIALMTPVWLLFAFTGDYLAGTAAGRWAYYLLFAAAWYCVVKQPLFFDELGFTADSVDMMSHYCKLGVISSLALYAVCIILRLVRRSVKKKKREQRLEEKRQRQREEYLTATQMALTQAGLDATIVSAEDMRLPGDKE